MVDQVPTKEETSSGAHGGDRNEKKALQGNKALRRKVCGTATLIA